MSLCNPSRRSDAAWREVTAVICRKAQSMSQAWEGSWKPKDGYLVANYPRILSGLVHPSYSIALDLPYLSDDPTNKTRDKTYLLSGMSHQVE